MDRTIDITDIKYLAHALNSLAKTFESEGEKSIRKESLMKYVEETINDLVKDYYRY